MLKVYGFRWPVTSAGITPTAALLPEQPWSEIVQAPAPRQPFVRGTRRFEIHVVNSRVGERVTKILGPGTLHRPDSQEQNFHLLVERAGIREHAIARRLRIEPAA